MKLFKRAEDQIEDESVFLTDDGVLGIHNANYSTTVLIKNGEKFARELLNFVLSAQESMK